MNVRNGKTYRDRKSGAHARRFSNRAMRDAYCGWAASSESAAVTTVVAAAKFPLAVCNGKASRALKRKTKK
jgi:hypothetical protein